MELVRGTGLNFSFFLFPFFGPLFFLMSRKILHPRSRVEAGFHDGEFTNNRKLRVSVRSYSCLTVFHSAFYLPSHYLMYLKLKEIDKKLIKINYSNESSFRVRAIFSRRQQSKRSRGEISSFTGEKNG